MSKLANWVIFYHILVYKINIVRVYYITTILLLLITAIYLYWQNRHLAKYLKFKNEIENNQQAFVATVVHDLKTPTNAQISSLNLLKNEAFGKLNSEQQEIIKLTQESCKYMSNLIGTIMEAYKNDLGDINLKKSKFDINELIRIVCKENEILSINKKQTLVYNYQNKPIFIYADKLQIKRVLQNLISNAITYGFDNSKIEIVIKISESIFELYVKNKSEEIPQNELVTVFDKFKKTKYACINNSGTGLGLYLAKQIIERHNGKIYAKSTKDGICTFGFKIPVCTGRNLQSNSNIRYLKACNK